MTGNDVSSGTAGNSVIPFEKVEEQQTASQSLHLGALRDRVNLIKADVDQRHKVQGEQDLEALTIAKAATGVKSLLNELGVKRGMAWADIARLIKVSVPAVRKWRTGEGSATAENRRALARLAAFLDLLEQYPIEDPAQWMEMAILDPVPITGMDLYRNDHWDLLLRFAEAEVTAEQIMDIFDSEWRSHYSPDFRVVEAGDGDLSLKQARQ